MYADKLSMAHGLEVRVPYLDREVVEFASACRRTFKVRYGRAQVAAPSGLRSAPAARASSRARSAASPSTPSTLVPRLDGPGMVDSLSPRSVTSRMCDYLDLGAIGRLRRRRIAPDAADNHKMLFSLIVLEAWLRANAESAAAPCRCVSSGHGTLAYDHETSHDPRLRADHARAQRGGVHRADDPVGARANACRRAAGSSSATARPTAPTPSSSATRTVVLARAACACPRDGHAQLRREGPRLRRRAGAASGPARSTSSATSTPTSPSRPTTSSTCSTSSPPMPELGVAGTHYVEGDFHSFRDSYINRAARERPVPAVPPGVLRGHRRLRADRGRRHRLGRRDDGADEGLDDPLVRRAGVRAPPQDGHGRRQRAAGPAIHYGKKDYFLGGHPLWQLFRSTFQMAKPPYVRRRPGPAGRLLWCWLTGRERPVSPELMRFHRGEQMARLKEMLLRRVALDRRDAKRRLTPPCQPAARPGAAYFTKETLVKGQPAPHPMRRDRWATPSSCNRGAPHDRQSRGRVVRGPRRSAGRASRRFEQLADRRPTCFTFWQRMPDVEPRHQRIHMEWEEIAVLPIDYLRPLVEEPDQVARAQPDSQGREGRPRGQGSAATTMTSSRA